jgi:hypothetical protein
MASGLPLCFSDLPSSAGRRAQAPSRIALAARSDLIVALRKIIRKRYSL